MCATGSGSITASLSAALWLFIWPWRWISFQAGSCSSSMNSPLRTSVSALWSFPLRSVRSQDYLVGHQSPRYRKRAHSSAPEHVSVNVPTTNTDRNALPKSTKENKCSLGYRLKYQRVCHQQTLDNPQHSTTDRALMSLNCLLISRFTNNGDHFKWLFHKVSKRIRLESKFPSSP